MIKRIWAQIKYSFNYAFFNEYRFRRVVRRHFMQFYTQDAPRATNKNKMIIAMFDGRRNHGGLADRLRGICTTYCYCRDNGLDFRVHFTSPFDLEDFLEPNIYDWRIADKEISYNIKDSHPVYISSQNYDEERDKKFQRRMTKKFLKGNYRQLHIYTNMRFEEERFGEAFNELFRPAQWLQKLIDEQISFLGGRGSYIVVSTRFREVLGDFNEHRDQAANGVSEEKAERLLQQCKEKVLEIHRTHPDDLILVTSDSNRFLNYMAQFDFVRTLPGKIGHMEIAGEEKEIHTKTFLDFMVVSAAKNIYFLVGEGMYRGNFSRRASQINDAPFNEIFF